MSLVQNSLQRPVHPNSNVLTFEANKITPSKHPIPQEALDAITSLAQLYEEAFNQVKAIALKNSIPDEAIWKVANTIFIKATKDLSI